MMDDWQHGAEAVGCKENFIRAHGGGGMNPETRRARTTVKRTAGSRQPGQARAGGPTHTARAAAGAEAGVAAGRQHKPPSSRN
ncbi:hypothetical protein CHLRE_01g009601v5 [Chlamydomonas reinhardtii]|uniref:Uncharacterized protein n=1 Tax=Chlamydomonas reinhardtii TaxID=3055 RepID=A0A2K3E5C6_CHLRE|nr:uncharacterized protein CHLRE_01g009601v5 [Chlamydomonas reinhardtii]PNW87984.1 hypothetical protein CHLRE_01g009601v5 [Chlamydomonas reinhardtii]